MTSSMTEERFFRGLFAAIGPGHVNTVDDDQHRRMRAVAEAIPETWPLFIPSWLLGRFYELDRALISSCLCFDEYGVTLPQLSFARFSDEEVAEFKRLAQLWRDA